MKKALVGCLVVGLLLIVVGGGAFYWFVVRPVGSAVGTLADNAKGLAAAAQVEDTISNKSPFTAPADGKITAAQAQSLVAVLTAMQSALGADLDKLKAKYDAIEAQQKAQGRDANLQEVAGAYSDFSGYVLKAKQAEAAALNQQNMSLEEYRWVRGQAYAALPFMEMDASALAAFSGTPAAGSTVANAQPPEPAASTAAPSMPDTGNAAANAQVAAAMAEAQQAQAQMAKAAADAQKAINDSPEIQAAKANALVLKPYKDIIEKTAGTTWIGF
jgi:hypothetical protein